MSFIVAPRHGKTRTIRNKELLAILPEALNRDTSAMWWDEMLCVPDNERIGNVAVVHVRGSLDHHQGFGHDSYESIINRVYMALNDSGPVSDDGRQSQPPSHVVLRLDSPGGVVSGLNETVARIKSMVAKKGATLCAYVDELAASAAYALACAADKIYLPPSGICGSVGVISVLCDQVGADEKAGLNFVTIQSGDRKSDGHPHVSVTPGAVDAEKRRLNQMADQFFQLVSASRGIPAKQVASYQAGIFMGPDAVKAGLADEVIGWDAFLDRLLSGTPESIKKSAKSSDVAQNGTKSLAQHAVQKVKSGKVSKSMKKTPFASLIASTKLQLASAESTKEKLRLTTALATFESARAEYEKVKHKVETTEQEYSSSEEDEEEDEEEEEAAAKGNETDRKEAKSGKSAAASKPSAESGDEDDEDEDDEDEAAAKAAVKAAAGGSKRAMGTLAATFGKARKFDKLNGRVAKIEAEAMASRKSAMIDEAVAQRRILRHEAKDLRQKPMAFVEGFLEMHKGARVNTDDEATLVPKDGPTAGIDPKLMRSIDDAISANPELKTRESQDKMRASMVEAHRERIAKANLTNGARY